MSCFIKNNYRFFTKLLVKTYNAEYNNSILKQIILESSGNKATIIEQTTGLHSAAFMDGFSMVQTSMYVAVLYQQCFLLERR